MLDFLFGAVLLGLAFLPFIVVAVVCVLLWRTMFH